MPTPAGPDLAHAQLSASPPNGRRWARLGHEVGFGVGIALGFATLGEVGFQARRDYTAIGRVVALASRLCDEASDGEILVSPQVQAAVENIAKSERLAELTLKGFHKPIAPYNMLGLVEDQVTTKRANAMATTVATLTGSPAMLSDEDLANLRMSVRGQVLTPDDAGYADVRPAYNAMHPGSPAIVVVASGTADVIDAVNFARDHDLLVAVRGGGHSVAGLSSVDGGMLIDLAPMRGVDVDPEARIARVQGGALLGDMDRETQAFGLVAPGGVVSDTGVAGLALGGGEGWARRKYGLSCDNILSAQVVCADGKLRTASADTNPDLYWALRGGGGNFGVVTSLTFQLHPMGPIVAFTGVFYPVADAAQVWRGFRDWALTAPDEVSALCACTTLPAHEALPPEIHDTPFIVVGAVYSGDPDDGMKVMQPLRNLATPLVDISQPLPFVGVQAAFDPFFVRGTLRSYWKSMYVNEITDDMIELLAKKAAERPSKRTFAPITFLMGGAINRVDPAATAYSERSANYMLSIDGNWSDPAEDEKVISWVRDTWADFAPYGTGGVYLNFRSLADESEDSDVENAFGDNMRRLAEVKAKYDPTNFFRRNNNITPAG